PPEARDRTGQPSSCSSSGTSSGSWAKLIFTNATWFSASSQSANVQDREVFGDFPHFRTDEHDPDRIFVLADLESERTRRAGSHGCSILALTRTTTPSRARPARLRSDPLPVRPMGPLLRCPEVGCEDDRSNGARSRARDRLVGERR